MMRWLSRARTRVHTDREILRCIFDMYQGDYPVKGDPLIPVDVEEIARTLGCHPRLLFGRLHHDMGTRLKHRDPADPRVILASVFEVQAGDQHHVANFPYLTAVLAQLEERRRRDLWTVGLSILAIVVAVASAVISLLTSEGS